MQNSILKVNDLGKTYYTDDGEIKAIESISFEVKEGEFLCIVGSSGCGKSTLLSILTDLEKPTKGEIFWKNKNPKIGYMLQNDALFSWLTVFENAALGLKIRKEDEDVSKRYVKKLLMDYGLKKFMDKYPGELSGGMRQRVG